MSGLMPLLCYFILKKYGQYCLFVTNFTKNFIILIKNKLFLKNMLQFVRKRCIMTISKDVIIVYYRYIA